MASKSTSPPTASQPSAPAKCQNQHVGTSAAAQAKLRCKLNLLDVAIIAPMIAMLVLSSCSLGRLMRALEFPACLESRRPGVPVRPASIDVAQGHVPLRRASSMDTRAVGKHKCFSQTESRYGSATSPAAWRSVSARTKHHANCAKVLLMVASRSPEPKLAGVAGKGTFLPESETARSVASHSRTGYQNAGTPENQTASSGLRISAKKRRAAEHAAHSLHSNRLWRATACARRSLFGQNFVHFRSGSPAHSLGKQYHTLCA